MRVRRRRDLEERSCRSCSRRPRRSRPGSGRRRWRWRRTGVRSSRMMRSGLKSFGRSSTSAAVACGWTRSRRRRRPPASRRTSAVGPTATGVVELDAHALEALAEVDAVLRPGRRRRSSRRCRVASSSMIDVGRDAAAGADHASAPAAGCRSRAPRRSGEPSSVVVRLPLATPPGRNSCTRAADAEPRRRPRRSGAEEVKTKMPSEVASSASGFGSCIQKPFVVLAVTIPGTRTTWRLQRRDVAAPWIVVDRRGAEAVRREAEDVVGAPCCRAGRSCPDR